MPLSVSPGSSTAKAVPSSSNTKDRSPAFQGASRAFSTNATAPVIASNGVNGALAAASFAGSGGGRGQTQPYPSDGLSQLSRQNTGQSLRSRDPSPSHVAANLAVSQAFRRPSRTHDPSDANQQTGRRPSPLRNVPTRPLSTDGQSESMSSPATKSLVQLYESKQNLPLQKTQSVRYVSKPGPPIRSPKPVRPLARSISSSANVTSNKVQAPLVPTNTNDLRSGGGVSPHAAGRPATKLVDPAFERPLRNQGSQTSKHETFAAQPRRKEPQTGAEDNAKIKLKPMPARPLTALPAEMDQYSQEPLEDAPRVMKAMSSVYSQSQPSSSSESKGPSPLSTRPSIQSTKSFNKTPPPPPLPTRQLSTYMSVDSLANAMVASSLASSRAHSPTKSFPPLPPPPRRHHFFQHHPHPSQELNMSRTPSPAKPILRQTMRQPPDSDDEATDAYKRVGKKHLVRKHQHKHHEGDRKRYRTQVTERERKRYEGVWAANRGLLIPTPANDNGGVSNTITTDAVLNIVVKDLWRRSQLPDDVLEEVWELVTGSQDDLDRLGREEFVVGLWLIDQRLKGNKLPVKVSESVWASVRRLPGIKVPRNKR